MGAGEGGYRLEGAISESASPLHGAPPRTQVSAEEMEICRDAQHAVPLQGAHK
jgi:hypothetical protein